MKLLTTQKNVIFDFIQIANMEHDMFQINEDNNKSIIKYVGTEFFFNFDEEVKNLGITSVTSLKFSPGENDYVEKVFIDDTSFATKLSLFNKWLSSLIKEVNVVDKWSQLKKEISNIRLSDFNDSSSFNANEQEEINTKITTLKQRVQTLNLPPDKLSIIEKKLDHLTTLTISLTKTDWNALFLGTLATMIIAVALTPESGKQIWEYAKQVFSNLFLY